MDRLSISRFFLTPPGQLMVDWEQNFFAETLAKTPTTLAVQIGTPELNTLAKTQIHTQVIVSENAQALTAINPEVHRICAHYAQLPIESESVECVIVPHTLDWSDYPEQVLREATRILAPQGRIYLAHFNPMSLWWMRQRLNQWGLRHYLPTRTQARPLSRWVEWLQLMGLHVDRGHYGLYRPASHELHRLEQWAWLDKAGDRWFPHMANLMVISAIKNPEQPKWVGHVKRPTPLSSLSTREGGAAKTTHSSCENTL